MRHVWEDAKEKANVEMGKKGVCATQGNGGSLLRGCETASWAPLCAVLWTE